MALVPQVAKPIAPDPNDPTGALIAALAAATAPKLKQSEKKSQVQNQNKRDESSSDDEEHPPDPQHCIVSGPGFAVGEHRAWVRGRKAHLKVWSLLGVGHALRTACQPLCPHQRLTRQTYQGWWR